MEDRKTRKFIDSNGFFYDSYNSDYMIFVSMARDWNCLKKTDIEHICFCKDIDRIKKFVQFCERSNKFIIFLKRDNREDILRDLATKDYDVIDYHEQNLSEEIHSYIRDIITSKIKDINKRKEAIRTGELFPSMPKEDEDDDEVDMSDTESV